MKPQELVKVEVKMQNSTNQRLYLVLGNYRHEIHSQQQLDWAISLVDGISNSSMCLLTWIEEGSGFNRLEIYPATRRKTQNQAELAKRFSKKDEP